MSEREANVNDEPRISFNVGDYIDRIMKEVRDGFDKLDRRLEAKADKSTVEAMRDDLNGVKSDVSDLKTNAVTQAALRRLSSRFFWLIAAVACGVLGDVAARLLGKP